MNASMKRSHHALFAAYALPYAAYVASAALLAGPLGAEGDYAVRIVATAGLLLYFRRSYASLTGPNTASASSIVGAAAGLIGALLWVALVVPFAGDESVAAPPPRAFALRLAAATLLVPFAEELLLRGWLLRLVLAWEQARAAGAVAPLDVALHERSPDDTIPGQWSSAAVLVSSMAFAIGHDPERIPAAFAYGLLMAGLWVARRDLLTCVVAHGVTNLSLYLFAYNTDRWGLV